MPNGFLPAPPEVMEVVNRVMGDFFPHLVLERRLVVAIREQAQDVGNEQVSVAATGVNSEEGAPFDYIIWFALDAWQLLDDGDREALVFHELMHCGRDEAGRPQLIEHDAAIFNPEVTRYGLWWVDAQARYKAARDRTRGESRT
jgi:hypothetical protein